MNDKIEFYDQAIRDLSLAIAKKECEIESIITQMEHHKEKRKSESITRQKTKFPTTSTVNPYITRASLESKLQNRKMGKRTELKKMNSRFNRLITKRSQLKAKLQNQGITVPELVSEPVEVPTINLCTNCQCPRDFDSDNCVHCGGVLVGSQTPSSCPNCQSSIEGKTQFCPNCGTVLEGLIDTQYSTIVKSSTSGGSNTGGIISVIFGILGLFYNLIMISFFSDIITILGSLIFGIFAIGSGGIGVLHDDNKSAGLLGILLGGVNIVIVLVLY